MVVLTVLGPLLSTAQTAKANVRTNHGELNPTQEGRTRANPHVGW